MKKEKFQGEVNGKTFQSIEEMTKYVNELAEKNIPVHSYRTEYSIENVPDDEVPQTDTIEPIPAPYNTITDYIHVPAESVDLDCFSADEDANYKIMKDLEAKLEKRMAWYTKNMKVLPKNMHDMYQYTIKRRIENDREVMADRKEAVNAVINNLLGELNRCHAQLECLESVSGYNEAMHDIVEHGLATA